MYAWRTWSREMRQQELMCRRVQQRPWHGPPHFTGQQTDQYLITGTCYEHAAILGADAGRLDAFAEQLLEVLASAKALTHAWCLLPNHYHVLVTAEDLTALAKRLGRLHGRSSHAWNREEHQRGRQCWHRVCDRAMRSEAHFWTSLNYIHHNPVKHGWVDRWTEWPWSSAHDYLREEGTERAARIWKAYPLHDYGASWDQD